MTHEAISQLRQRQERAADIAERASIIPDAESGMRPDIEQDAAGKGNRGAPGVIPMSVGNEFTSRPLIDLAATLSDGYVAR